MDLYPDLIYVFIILVLLAFAFAPPFNTWAEESPFAKYATLELAVREIALQLLYPAIILLVIGTIAFVIMRKFDPNRAKIVKEYVVGALNLSILFGLFIFVIIYVLFGMFYGIAAAVFNIELKEYQFVLIVFALFVCSLFISSWLKKRGRIMPTKMSKSNKNKNKTVSCGVTSLKKKHR